MEIKKILDKYAKIKIREIAPVEGDRVSFYLNSEERFYEEDHRGSGIIVAISFDRLQLSILVEKKPKGISFIGRESYVFVRSYESFLLEVPPIEELLTHDFAIVRAMAKNLGQVLEEKRKKRMRQNYFRTISNFELPKYRTRNTKLRKEPKKEKEEANERLGKT